MKEFVYVFIGGGLGSIARYWLSIIFAKKEETLTFPWHTFFANTLGCFIIGLVVGILSKQSNNWLPFLIVTGFCGGFTTFSTFSLELIRFFRLGDFLHGIIYLVLSLVICVSFTIIGIFLSKFV